MTAAQLIRMDTFVGPQAQDTRKWAQFVEELKERKEPDPEKKEMDERQTAAAPQNAFSFGFHHPRLAPPPPCQSLVPPSFAARQVVGYSAY
ncbi:hypothetical protein DFH09DRAFT_1336328 [Mycena vulgaris]|nr:hypothetical protein DFH09DRAFT_1336328 [Mycena vulgaris]